MDRLARAIVKDLAASGIRPPHLAKLKLKYLDKTKTKKLCGVEKESYLIPYFKMDGNIDKEFWRIRLLEEHKVKGKIFRYTQPADTRPKLYYPPYLKWPNILQNPKETLYITEGEKKAAKACIEGMNTIGLGGVWNWKSKKKNIPILDDFKKMNLKEREVNIIYDSDISTNPLVKEAMYALGLKLSEMGAKVYCIYLPSDTDEKVGLDDFLLKNKPDDLLDLEFQEFNFLEPIQKLNNEIAVVQEIAMIYDLRYNKQITVEKARLLYPQEIMVITEKGKQVFKNIIDMWVKSPIRRVHNKLVYNPGESETTEGNDLNLWHGWGTTSKKGSHILFIELMEFLFQGLNRNHMTWIYQWFAYPIQNPGYKLPTACLLYGAMNGTGKSLLGLTIRHIYGARNCSTIGQDQLYGQYNGWLARKQFIHGEEITGSDKRKDIDRLKQYITQDTVMVNEKYEVGYNLRDCSNFYLTSNHGNSIYINDKDRRFFCHEIDEEPLEQSFYSEYCDRLLYGDKKLLKAIFHYLKEEVDCESFQQNSPAPLTASKREMIEMGRSEVEAWLYKIKTNPEEGMKIDNIKWDGREIYEARELHERYKIEFPEKQITSQGFGLAMKRVGFQRAKKQIKVEGRNRRFWIITNIDYWRKKKLESWRAHYLSKKAKNITNITRKKLQ